MRGAPPKSTRLKNTRGRTASSARWLGRQLADPYVRAAKAEGARALVQISGIGSNASSPNAYIASKGRGEDLAREAFPSLTILRPSVVFGPEDDFFNRFAQMATPEVFLF